jgi:hypothetical protein
MTLVKIVEKLSVFKYKLFQNLIGERFSWPTARILKFYGAQPLNKIFPSREPLGCTFMLQAADSSGKKVAVSGFFSDLVYLTKDRFYEVLIYFAGNTADTFLTIC